jgi:O-antigen ligase
MPEHIRALIVIIFLAIIGFSLAKKIVQQNIIETDFNKWRNVWFAVTITAFIVQNFWLYLLISSVLIVQFTKRLKNKMALFFILLFVIPPIGITVPGFGLVNYIFEMTHPRFIAIIILLPAAIAISRGNSFKFGSTFTDKCLLLYLIVLVCLELRDTTFTDSLRKCFNMFIDIFLPYYVASRGIKDLSQMKTTMSALVTSAIVIGLLAIFESGKKWLLYNTLGEVLGAGDSMSNYLGRSGEIRAVATLSHPIILGYFMTIVLGFYLFLSQSIAQSGLKKLGFLIIILGLLAPLSRGPWVGAFAMITVYLLYGPSASKKISMLLFASIISFSVLAALPGGQKYINLIPFIGETEKGNITYREQLFENSIIVIKRNPLFGSSNYLETPEMLEMKQGGGIIDIVNSYLRVTLETGYVGLILFVGVFISAILNLRKHLKIVRDKNNPLHILGRSLIAILIGIMITIATASSIATVPIMYWSMAGLALAYSRIVKLNFQTNT